MVSGSSVDDLEVKWLRACWTKYVDSLETSIMATGQGDALRWRCLDFAMSRALQGVSKNSGESWSEDVALKIRLFRTQSNILRGGHIMGW